MYEGIIERWTQANPIKCQGLGLHEFDTKVPKRNKEIIKSRIEELEADLEYLNGLPDPSTVFEQLEYGLIQSALELEHFELAVRKEYLTSAAHYVTGWYNTFNIVQKSHTQRNYAPIDDRVRSITGLQQNFPKVLNEAMDNLADVRLAVASTQSSLNYVNGYISYYQDELIEFVMQAEDETVIDEWSVANNLAVDALVEFRSFLEEKLETAHQDFALGEDNFLQLLKYTEGIDISVDRLLEVGYADLERNYTTMVDIARKRGQEVDELITEMQNDYPDPEHLLEYTKQSADRAREFVLQSDLVTVPSETQCQVIYTPKSDRKFEFASMNTPGPFEVPEAAEAYYRVNPPDLSWSKERIHQFMKFFNKSFFESVTVHEAWPGHYLQLLYTQKSRSEIAKMLAKSITMVEGWAHYCEEMIYEQGYEPFDRDLYHAGQLFGALIRNVRFISAVQMHCRGMTVEESKQMFMEKAFMPEPNAEIEANRGTIDPMYLNYTLGKLLIKKLRTEYQKEKGDEFSLMEFHDRLLSYGSAPITLLRSILLEHPDPEIL